MPSHASRPEADPSPPGFSEKGFYLQEFRGKTLAFAVRAAELSDPAPLLALCEELARNETYAALLCDDAAALRRLVGRHVLALDRPRIEGAVWRGLLESFRVGLQVPPGAAFASACRELALRLGIGKLVWIDAAGGLERTPGSRASFVDLRQLREILAREEPETSRRSLLREVEAALVAGVPAVNVCSLAGLHDELFTYAGSGTLFTRERYVAVRKLGIDDFDAASDLIARGTCEGFLAPRSEDQIDEILASGFGAFVASQHLAGIGALLVDASRRSAEIASLYTLTRFLGEGVGSHLVDHALERARAHSLERVHACTTSERVAEFFEQRGFSRVSAGSLPAERWRDYPGERRSRVLCLRLELPAQR